ncbi:MAG: hypothetical protein QOG79_6679 [Mycobacterium sp.]|nr:hypothetical protein [Mycobacterium sp.]
MPYTININDVSRTVDVDGEWPTRRTVRDELAIDHPPTTERLPLTKE